MNSLDKSFKTRLEEIVEILGGKVKTAKAASVSRQTVNNYIEQKTAPNLGTLILWCNKAGKSLEWLLFGTNVQSAPGFTLIPRINVAAAAGAGIEVGEEQIVGHLAFSDNWLKWKNLDSSKCLMIKALGDSMSPTINNAEVCLVDMSDNTPKKEGVYAISVLGQARIKRLIIKHNAVVLRSDNDEYDDEIIPHGEAENLKVVGRVIWRGGDIP